MSSGAVAMEPKRCHRRCAFGYGVWRRLGGGGGQDGAVVRLADTAGRRTSMWRRCEKSSLPHGRMHDDWWVVVPGGGHASEQADLSVAGAAANALTYR